MHRECGTLVELSPQHGRAIGKMKATITHRFKFSAANGAAGSSQQVVTNGGEPKTQSSPCSFSSSSDDDEYEFDVDCDCRFIFFCQKEDDDGDGASWKARYVKLFYEKDKVVPVDGRRLAPRFTPEELARYPRGYRYLGAAQARLGYDIDLRLPTAGGELWERMYGQMERWLEGEEVDLFWEHK
ncbi:hypothetical protein VTK56DRAFT_6693 [Thermocarpiscus australiensis]